jgi:L-alanine-DL-glutamate epimerase-like enolase superfamily enzyme
LLEASLATHEETDSCEPRIEKGKKRHDRVDGHRRMRRSTPLERRSPSDDKVAWIKTHVCRFELPAPITLHGGGSIAAREYLVIRVGTEGGLEGSAWALTRGAPVASVIEELIAPSLIGHDALATLAFRERVERSLTLLGTEGLVERAISLLDIALWDIKGKIAGLPIWRLLGGAERTLPALLVDSYPSPGDDTASVADAVAARASEGFRAMKLHFANDPTWMSELLILH